MWMKRQRQEKRFIERNGVGDTAGFQPLTN
jgi:hypothetical protein